MLRLGIVAFVVFFVALVSDAGGAPAIETCSLRQCDESAPDKSDDWREARRQEMLARKHNVGKCAFVSGTKWDFDRKQLSQKMSSGMRSLFIEDALCWSGTPYELDAYFSRKLSDDFMLMLRGEEYLGWKISFSDLKILLYVATADIRVKIALARTFFDCCRKKESPDLRREYFELGANLLFDAYSETEKPNEDMNPEDGAELELFFLLRRRTLNEQYEVLSRELFEGFNFVCGNDENLRRELCGNLGLDEDFGRFNNSKPSVSAVRSRNASDETAMLRELLSRQLGTRRNLREILTTASGEALLECGLLKIAPLDDSEVFYFSAMNRLVGWGSLPSSKNLEAVHRFEAKGTQKMSFRGGKPSKTDSKIFRAVGAYLLHSEYGFPGTTDELCEYFEDRIRDDMDVAHGFFKESFGKRTPFFNFHRALRGMTIDIRAKIALASALFRRSETCETQRGRIELFMCGASLLLDTYDEYGELVPEVEEEITNSTSAEVLARAMFYLSRQKTLAEYREISLLKLYECINFICGNDENLRRELCEKLRLPDKFRSESCSAHTLPNASPPSAQCRKLR